MIASASMLEGFCSSVGDIENPNTGALPATTFSTPPSLVASPAFITQPASPARISGQSSETQSSQSQVAAPALMPVFTFTPPTVLAALPPISSPIINAAPSSTPATIPILGDPSVQSGPSHSLSSGNSAFASGDSGSISASTASSPSAHKTPTTLQQTTASSSTTTKSSTLQVSEGDSLQSLTKATQFEVILISGACAVVLLFLC
ncbi:hypothetical protein BGZ60DRAFT_401136 [Tricladium varicosporioides]|nr:hypothetical protein BGZ60DRAFT_401136 [Hymenoscyphus varicosporioides]